MFNYNEIHKSRISVTKSCFKYALCLLFVMIIFACSAKDTKKPVTSSLNPQNIPSQIEETNSTSPESVQIEKTNSTSPESVPQKAYQGDYIIGPGDLLEINVYQVDELARTVRVSASGYIKLPLVDKVKASGLTAPELEMEIARKYYNYLQEPVVSVFIKDYRSQKVTVLGAVKSPKVHTVTNQNYLLDMLTFSGGLTADAGEICYVRRGSETIVINIDDLLIKGKTELNIPIFAGDIIHFPVGGVLFVDGAVRSPGSFPLKGTVTVTQAISMAKGLNSVSIPGELKIFRDTGKETRDVIPVDYNAIIAQKAPDIVLKDNDIVIVPKSAIKEFIRSISGAVSIGKGSLSGGL